MTKQHQVAQKIAHATRKIFKHFDGAEHPFRQGSRKELKKTLRGSAIADWHPPTFEDLGIQVYSSRLREIYEEEKELNYLGASRLDNSKRKLRPLRDDFMKFMEVVEYNESLEDVEEIVTAELNQLDASTDPELMPPPTTPLDLIQEGVSNFSLDDREGLSVLAEHYKEFPELASVRAVPGENDGLLGDAARVRAQRREAFMGDDASDNQAAIELMLDSENLEEETRAPPKRVSSQKTTVDNEKNE